VTTAVDITKYAIGRARIGFRAVGVLTPYTVIPTIEDCVIRLNAGAEVFDPSLELDLGGPIQGFQYQPRVGGIEAEFSIAQLDATNLGLLMPGSTSATATGATVGGGLSTTTTAAAVVGDTTLPLTAVTGAAVGDFIKIDTGGNAEYRQITAITSLVVSFFSPLALAHASGVAVVEVDGDLRTTFTPPAVGRLASTSYKEFIVEWPRPDTSWGTVKIYRGLPALDNAYELTTGPRTMGRVRCTITGYRDPATVDAAPVALIQ
jgi:hypothetical protein